MTPTSPFKAEHGAVTWLTPYGPVRLDERMREGMLTAWQDGDPDIARLYNALHEAHVKAGGISRVSDRRAA